MFKSIFSQSIQWYMVIIALIASLLLGFLFAVIFARLKTKEGYSKDMPITLTIFPFVASALIILVFFLTNNLVSELANSSSIVEARILRYGVALISVLTMTRFRSQQRSTEELTYVFFSVFMGVCIGLGFLYFGLIVECILIATLFILNMINFPFIKSTQFKLKITIPEDLAYETAFNEVFKKYLTDYELIKIRTSDLGTMFTLFFEVNLKKNVSQKELIDALREINGNLNIMLTNKKFDNMVKE